MPSWNGLANEADARRIGELWADSVQMSEDTLADLLEVGQGQLLAWLDGSGITVPDPVPVAWKIAEVLYVMDEWASLRGGQAQQIGPEGYPVTVSTWQLVLKARDLVSPPSHPISRLGVIS